MRKTVALACMASWLGLTGCSVTADMTEPQAVVHDPQDITANALQARMRVRGLIKPLTDVIVRAADGIPLREQTLRWRLDAVPALREALLRRDPIAAIADAWIFSWQQIRYFERGPGKTEFGAHAADALAASHVVEERIHEAAASLTASGDVSDARRFAREWAEQHPIEGSIAGRESTLSRGTQRKIKATFSTLETMGVVATTLNDLSYRLDVYSSQSLEQARWEAELLIRETIAEQKLDELVPLAHSTAAAVRDGSKAAQQMGPALDRAAKALEDAPRIIGAEREEALVTVGKEINRVLEFAQKERVAVLQHFASERELVLRELEEKVAEERKLALLDAERIGAALADRVMLRVAVGALVFGVALLIAFRLGLVRPQGGSAA